MRKPPRMDKIHRLAHVPNNRLGLSFGICSLLIQSLTQIPTPLKLHHYKVTSILFEVIDHWANVFVMQTGHNKYLLEYGSIDGGFDFLAQYAFHGDLSPSYSMDTTTDCGECSAFDLVLRIGADGVRGHRRGNINTTRLIKQHKGLPFSPSYSIDKPP